MRDLYQEHMDWKQRRAELVDLFAERMFIEYNIKEITKGPVFSVVKFKGMNRTILAPLRLIKIMNKENFINSCV